MVSITPDHDPRFMASASDSKSFIPHTFSNAISAKLTSDNFLTWMQHAEATIKGYKLQKYIRGFEEIPQNFLTKDNESKCLVNPEFENYEQQDNLLKSWLLESMNSQFKIRMVGCEWSYQIWQILKVYFASQTRARVKQLKVQLRAVKKSGLIADYLVQIKQIVETLTAIGSPISTEDHIDAIVDGSFSCSLLSH